MNFCRVLGVKCEGQSSVEDIGLELDPQSYDKQNSNSKLSIKPSLINSTQF